MSGVVKRAIQLIKCGDYSGARSELRGATINARESRALDQALSWATAHLGAPIVNHTHITG